MRTVSLLPQKISLKTEARERLPSALQAYLLQASEKAGGPYPFLLPNSLGDPPAPGWCFPAGTYREFDLLGPVGILEGVVSVLVGQARGADGSDHHCAAVAPEGVLKQAGQFAVPVGHMRLSALEGNEWMWDEVAGLDRARLGPGSLWPSAGGRNPWLEALSVVLLVGGCRGTLGLCSFTFASARALRTLMRASRERLMLAPSRSRSPFAWVLDALSEPARSIRLILATRRAWVRPGTRSCCFTKIWGHRAGVRRCWTSEAHLQALTHGPSHLEDGMRARGSSVGISGMLRAVPVPPGQHLQQLLS